jgi:hypothetical protein
VESGEQKLVLTNLMALMVGNEAADGGSSEGDEIGRIYFNFCAGPLKQALAA